MASDEIGQSRIQEKVVNDFKKLFQLNLSMLIERTNSSRSHFRFKTYF